MVWKEESEVVEGRYVGGPFITRTRQDNVTARSAPYGYIQHAASSQLAGAVKANRLVPSWLGCILMHIDMD